MSTADAILFMLATSLSQDLYKRFLNREASDAQVLRVARGAAVTGGVLGVLLALVAQTIIGTLSFFYSVLGVCLFVPVLAGLFARRFARRRGDHGDRRRDGGDARSAVDGRGGRGRAA